LIAGIASAQGIWKNKEAAQANSQGMGMGGGMMGGMMQGNMMKGMMQHHEEIAEIMDESTYSGLVKLREESGLNIMPWVENEEDFRLAKKMHDKMEKTGGCPMMNGNFD